MEVFKKGGVVECGVGLAGGVTGGAVGGDGAAVVVELVCGDGGRAGGFADGDRVFGWGICLRVIHNGRCGADGLFNRGVAGDDQQARGEQAAGKCVNHSFRKVYINFFVSILWHLTHVLVLAANLQKQVI